MLEEIAEAGVDGPFVLLADLDIVGHGSELRNRVPGLGQDDAGAVAVFRPRGVELLQRLEAGDDARPRLLPGAAGAAQRPPARSPRRRLGSARRAPGRGAPLVQLYPRRLAAGLERLDLCLQRAGRDAERLHLLLVEGDLLLQAPDRQLARVRRFPRGRRPRVRLGQLEAQPL